MHHEEVIASHEEKPVNEYVRNATSSDYTPCLQARDADWKKGVTKPMTENFKRAKDEIDSQMNANKPSLLIEKAKNALDSIDTNSAGFKKNENALIKGLDNLIEKAQSLKSLING